MEQQSHQGDQIRNVILTGFMGTGKSTVGRLLAKRLEYEWVDTDDLIESREGPIPEIFARQGEAAFRALEHQVAEELAQRQAAVISTGGRLMLDERNAQLLGATGDVFCLVAAPETIAERLGRSTSGPRPLLNGPDLRERIEHVMAGRAEGYSRFRAVNTDGRSVHEVVDELAEAFQAGGRIDPDAAAPWTDG